MFRKKNQTNKKRTRDGESKNGRQRVCVCEYKYVYVREGERGRHRMREIQPFKNFCLRKRIKQLEREQETEKVKKGYKECKFEGVYVYVYEREREKR